MQLSFKRIEGGENGGNANFSVDMSVLLEYFIRKYFHNKTLNNKIIS